MAASTLLAAPAANAQPTPGLDLTVEVTGLRDAKGLVRLCITGDQRDFPKCKSASAMSGSVGAGSRPVRYRFTGLKPGTYAIASFHDANGNGKLDTSLGIPREGFGFSRNPSVKPRAPRWNETSFTLTASGSQTIRMRYLL